MRILRPAIRMAFALAPTLLANAQIPVFKVTSEEVRIDLFVADHGKPITGLQAADFEIRDNGVRQEIEFAEYEQIPISTILIFDMSESVAGGRLAHLKSAGDAFLGVLKKDEKAALITFSHVVKLNFPLTGELERVRAALDKARPSGNTSLIDAIYAGLIVAESKSARSLIIVFSDSLDTSSWLADAEVLESAKGTDAVVYAVTIGRLLNNTFLHDLCKFTGGSLFAVDSTKLLGKVFLNILEEFRHRYLLTYIPRGVSSGGWHSLSVRVKHSHDKVIYRPGYIQKSTYP